jgi:pimeloyl-ACP methyl ester carboxylesterase
MGHSMGATIAPLTLAGEPRFRTAILSGAGGSYIHNLVYKQSPLEVRPLAEAMLNYGAHFREIHEHDPMLSMVQWAAESSDPPVYGSRIEADVLVLQGIVDTYILPPMANALNLSLGNDLAGASLDADHPDLQGFQTLESLLPLVGAETVSLPATGPRLVVQHAQGSIEDGHEVMFQTEAPQHQYRCFLESALIGTPIVPVGGLATDSCD